MWYSNCNNQSICNNIILSADHCKHEHFSLGSSSLADLYTWGFVYVLYLCNIVLRLYTSLLVSASSYVIHLSTYVHIALFSPDIHTQMGNLSKFYFKIMFKGVLASCVLPGFLTFKLVAQLSGPGKGFLSLVLWNKKQTNKIKTYYRVEAYFIIHRQCLWWHQPGICRKLAVVLVLATPQALKEIESAFCIQR